MLLSISAGHVLISHSFKVHVNTILPSKDILLYNGVFAQVIPAKSLCAYFLSVMCSTFLAHLVLDTPVCLDHVVIVQ